MILKRIRKVLFADCGKQKGKLRFWFTIAYFDKYIL